MLGLLGIAFSVKMFELVFENTFNSIGIGAGLERRVSGDPVQRSQYTIREPQISGSCMSATSLTRKLSFYSASSRPHHYSSRVISSIYTRAGHLIGRELCLIVEKH
eukprot:m.40356 g.40356  ORF g.40356 m.40356 type:complete len:106 (+) comp8068_c0_seq1:137-454(+)